MRTALTYAISLLLAGISTLAQENITIPKLQGPYLGQKTPGNQPELFAPGFICTGFNERDITFSPDGKEIFYGFLTSRNITIMYTKMISGQWTEPQVAPFALDDRFFYLEPCFSADGKRIYFLSTRPPEGREPKPRWFYQNIWASDKKPDGSWSEPYNPDTLLNQLNSQFYPTLTREGTIYFTRSDEKTKKSDIYRARKSGEKFGEIEKLPPVVNQEGTNTFNAFISPDESFLIACIDGRKNDINPGFTNYYIFFRDKNDKWSEGISFGPEINIKGSNAISASVSPDGKYLFFTAQVVSKKNEERSKTRTLRNMLDVLNSPQNGNQDIYWVDATLIEHLRPKP